MHAGDLASMDENGYACIVGRSKDMIIRVGENVYPRELEEFFFTHPAVANVQVIGKIQKFRMREISIVELARRRTR
ncbi:AMP-binding protein [Pseudomonas sp. TCU-HL1]|nr:AMP-binding protein [Pseudomonas sp. TCU-HL1]